jgi:hypothetical protein
MVKGLALSAHVSAQQHPSRSLVKVPHEIHHQLVKMTAAPLVVSPTSSRLSRTPPCLSILIPGQKYFDQAPGNMLAL